MTSRMGGLQVPGAASPPTILPVSSRFCDVLALTTLVGYGGVGEEREGRLEKDRGTTNFRVQHTCGKMDALRRKSTCW